MLTPVDIQQKKFHIGIGYDKKDVNAFFEEVAESFEILYRSNAELREKVDTLTDGLQNYKSKEAALEKSLLSAEKVSEDTKSKATKEAKNIELEAKNKAKIIIGDAEERLEAIKEELLKLETQYAAYKSNFCNLMKQQYEMLKQDDFDMDAYIDEKSLSLLGGSISVAPSENSSFGAFSGDPQMRDESSLGGMSGGGMSKEELTSTSAVYTSSLSANENFVDPFNPNKQDNGRYNPYDGRTPATEKKTNKTTFTVKPSGSSSKSRPRKTPAKPVTESASTPSVDTTEKSTEFKPADVKKEETSYAEKVFKKPEEDMSQKPIPTVDLGLDEDISESTAEENGLMGDVEIKDKAALLGDFSVTNEETDEFGFEFV